MASNEIYMKQISEDLKSFLLQKDGKHCKENNRKK